jgi:hypothetical protein
MGLTNKGAQVLTPGPVNKDNINSIGDMSMLILWVSV